MEFACKKFVTPQGILFACCDKEILGKKLIDGKLNIEIEISQEFYFEKFCGEEEIKKNFDEAKIMNFFGNNVVEFLIKEKLVDTKNVKEIAGIKQCAGLQIMNLLNPFPYVKR